MTIFHTFWENFVEVFVTIIAAVLQSYKQLLFYSTTVHVGIFHGTVRFWGEFDIKKVANFIFHIFQRTLWKILATWPWEYDDWCIHMSSIRLSVCLSVNTSGSNSSWRFWKWPDIFHQLLVYSQYSQQNQAMLAQVLRTLVKVCSAQRELLFVHIPNSVLKNYFFHILVTLDPLEV